MYCGLLDKFFRGVGIFTSIKDLDKRYLKFNVTYCLLMILGLGVFKSFFVCYKSK